jgi:hypothetical protein
MANSTCIKNRNTRRQKIIISNFKPLEMTVHRDRSKNSIVTKGTLPAGMVM